LLRYLETRTRIIAVVAISATLGTGALLRYLAVAVFALSAWRWPAWRRWSRGTDQLSERFGPGATGVLQSALGNLPSSSSASSLFGGSVDVVERR